MFIVCSNCEFKYLVNSADLKPNGRMVECVNCNHQWFQELDNSDLTSSVPSSKKEELDQDIKNNKQQKKLEEGPVKNLPSTVVRQENPSVINSTIVIALAIIVILAIWIYRSYGLNTFVIIDFYIREFFFNLNLIISDLAKIIHNTLN
ncbi:zinc-ribbon domain-containing protein [Pelagibacteraceae bacterium]|nr:zinc-ribbon domain-containing protein [Pelagibacteraceae bacterium]